MERLIIPCSTPSTCAPLTTNKELGDCWVGGYRFSELQFRCLAGMVPTVLPVYVRSDAWVPCEYLSELVADGVHCAYVNEAGDHIACTGGTAAGPAADSLTIPAPAACFAISVPWDLLAVNEYVVEQLENNEIKGEVSEGASIDGCLYLGKGSRLLPGVFIEGKVWIGDNCKIGPNCTLRGNTAIGDGCRIGQSVEVKNSLLMPGVSLAHLSYCGDSIVGENTNFGAGTITANYRHDGANHRSIIGAELRDTGRRKLGAMIGDNVHTGIHTSIYPGRKIWPGLSTRPGDIVQRDLKP